MRSGTTSSGRLAGSAKWVGDDRDKWRYRLVRSQRTLRQCAGGRCWRLYMLRAAAALGSQGGSHRCCACCGCRNHRCIRGIGDRDSPWCLGVPSDAGPSYRTCQRRFKACRMAAASFPLALAQTRLTITAPAVTIARCLSDTFAGIRPGDVPEFILAQFLGAFGATLFFRWVVPDLRLRGNEVLLAHDPGRSGSPDCLRNKTASATARRWEGDL